MQTGHVQHYLNRADDFLAGMRLVQEEETCSNASALLAVHSALSYADALRVGLGQDQVSADDHKKAIKVLRKLLAERRLKDSGGIQHLDYLISNKSFVAYGTKELSAVESENMCTKAERFAKWISGVAKELKVEGWRT